MSITTMHIPYRAIVSISRQIERPYAPQSHQQRFGDFLKRKKLYPITMRYSFRSYYYSSWEALRTLFQSIFLVGRIETERLIAYRHPQTNQLEIDTHTHLPSAPEAIPYERILSGTHIVGIHLNAIGGIGYITCVE